MQIRLLSIIVYAIAFVSSLPTYQENDAVTENKSPKEFVKESIEYTQTLPQTQQKRNGDHLENGNQFQNCDGNFVIIDQVQAIHAFPARIPRDENVFEVARLIYDLDDRLEPVNIQRFQVGDFVNQGYARLGQYGNFVIDLQGDMEYEIADESWLTMTVDALATMRDNNQNGITWAVRDKDGKIQYRVRLVKVKDATSRP